MRKREREEKKRRRKEEKRMRKERKRERKEKKSHRHTDGTPLHSHSLSPSPPRPPQCMVVFGSAEAKNLRPYMEDRHTMIESLSIDQAGQAPSTCVFAGVYDGHNGIRTAEVAQAQIHKEFVRALEMGHQSVAEALKHAYLSVDDEILRAAKSDGGRDGAVALSVVLMEGVLHAAWCGDCRAVLARKSQALRLTEDHKPNRPDEKARVERAGGKVQMQGCWRVIIEPRFGRPGSGLACSRALGDYEFKQGLEGMFGGMRMGQKKPVPFVIAEPEVTSHALSSEDSYVILASDGLWDVVSNSESVATCNSIMGIDLSSNSMGLGRKEAAVKAKDAAEGLLHLALTRGSSDNITVCIMALLWD